MTSKAVVSTVGLLSLAVLPWIAVPTQAQIFNDVQAQLRVQWMQMKRDQPRHPNPRVQRLAECIAHAIIDVIPEEYQSLNWEIIVFDNAANNASVTPEGKIAVFSGLLEVADTPDELAAVLGHEIAHLTEGHVTDRVVRAAGTGLAGIAGSLITGVNVGDTAGIFLQLPFQRGQEEEADLVGMDFMAKAGYNPLAVVSLWKEMGSDRRGRQPAFLSTHPDPQFRLEDMVENLSPALATYNAALDAGVRPRCRL